VSCTTIAIRKKTLVATEKPTETEEVVSLPFDRFLATFDILTFSRPRVFYLPVHPTRYPHDVGCDDLAQHFCAGTVNDVYHCLPPQMQACHGRTNRAFASVARPMFTARTL
jgi:hypothetical protein